LSLQADMPADAVSGPIPPGRLGAANLPAPVYLALLEFMRADSE
jgi:hypothetical protein